MSNKNQEGKDKSSGTSGWGRRFGLLCTRETGAGFVAQWLSDSLVTHVMSYDTCAKPTGHVLSIIYTKTFVHICVHTGSSQGPKCRRQYGWVYVCISSVCAHFIINTSTYFGLAVSPVLRNVRTLSCNWETCSMFFWRRRILFFKISTVGSGNNLIGFNRLAWTETNTRLCKYFWRYWFPNIVPILQQYMRSYLKIRVVFFFLTIRSNSLYT